MNGNQKPKHLCRRKSHKVTGFFFSYFCIQQKKDESSKNKRNSVQLTKIDQSLYLEEFDSFNQEGSPIVATPISRRDETGSEGSRESSTSGDSRAATKSLLNSSLISAQSDVVLRRPREGYSSPYVSTPVLPRQAEVESVRLRSATHDMSAFRARQVRSEIFTDSDWSPGRLGRPRSMDALDKLPSSSSTLTPGDTGSRDGHLSEDDLSSTLPRTKKQGMLKHASPAASPKGLRKPRWAKSSPNISPNVARKEYPIGLEPFPPSPPSPTSSRKTESPRSSPILARKLGERTPTRSPKHSPILSRKENIDTFSSPPGGLRRSSVPNRDNQSLDTIPVRERSTEPAKPRVAVIISPSNTTYTASSPFQEDQEKLVLQGVQSSPQEHRFNGDVSNSTPSYHELRQQSDGRHEQPITSTPRGFQRQRSFSGEKNIQAAEPPRTNIQHIRNRSSSGNRNDVPRSIQSAQAREGPIRDTDRPGTAHSRERSLSGDKNSGLRVTAIMQTRDGTNRDTSQIDTAHSRERTLSGDKNSGLRVTPIVHGMDGPSRDTRQTGMAHSRERSLSGDRNSGLRVTPTEQAKGGPNRDTIQLGPVNSRSLIADKNDGLRSSKRLGTLFVASSTPPQSVPVTAHYVTTGTIAKAEPIPPATSGVTTGVNSKSAPLTRAEASSSSVYAVVRDKYGDERVIPAATNILPSRDFPTLSRDQPSSRANATVFNDTANTFYSSPPTSRDGANVDTSTTSRYSYSLPRSGSVSNPVELKPDANELRDENRNETKLQVNAGGVHEASKENISNVRARMLEMEHQSPPLASQAFVDDNDDDDDTRSVSSQQTRDCSPALRKVRNKAKKATKEKEREIFVDLPVSSPVSSETGSTAPGRRSIAEERSRSRSAGTKEAEGKKSSIWYEYGCV